MFILMVLAIGSLRLVVTMHSGGCARVRESEGLGEIEVFPLVQPGALVHFKSMVHKFVHHRFT